MELGTLLQLEFNAANVNRKNSSLIGMKKGEYLIIELPDEFEQQTRPNYLEPGNSIIIRYINSSGVIYGVKSQITKVIWTPVKLMLVDYPKVIENHKLRKAKRSDCMLHSYVDVDNLLIEGHVVNISVDGCRASIDSSKIENKHLESGKNISLSVQLPGVEGVVSVDGVIRNVSKEAKKFMLGIQFGELKSKTKERINEFLETLEEPEGDDDFLQEAGIEV